jgi:hypothetical protein
MIKKRKGGYLPQGYAGCEQPTCPLRDQISDESRVAENNKIVFLSRLGRKLHKFPLKGRAHS